MKNMIKTGIKGGFTLIEIMVVVVILAIAMCAAVPMFSQAGTVQVQQAANMVAADMEYARSMAVSRQQRYGLIFDTANEQYQVIDQNSHAIGHPTKVGKNYIVDFRGDPGLGMGQVNIATASFDGTSKIWFDYLGSPLNGNATPGALGAGTITLQGGGLTMTITISPVTGYVQIQ